MKYYKHVQKISISRMVQTSISRMFFINSSLLGKLYILPYYIYIIYKKNPKYLLKCLKMMIKLI